MNSKTFTLSLIRNPGRILNALKRKLLKLETYEGKACITQFEIETLQYYAKRATRGIIEIGVLDAGTTREMGLVAHVPIYGIDPLIPDSMDSNLHGSIDIVKNNMKFYTQFHFFNDYSYNVVKTWDNAFDFIFIDGDHRYDAVKQDFEDWYPLLSDNGFVAFHDAAPVTSDPHNPHQGYEGPIRLVEELGSFDGLKYIGSYDSLVVFQKNSS
ncbi:MAG: class I SAM-dependent methyltransferase [Candidatus Magasanikbacteria bacterium]|nr:class I SAM-dependent methyltransferase [Candidatus Magasanikbacteria bacterium]